MNAIRKPIHAADLDRLDPPFPAVPLWIAFHSCPLLLIKFRTPRASLAYGCLPILDFLPARTPRLLDARLPSPARISRNFRSRRRALLAIATLEVHRPAREFTISVRVVLSRAGRKPFCNRWAFGLKTLVSQIHACDRSCQSPFRGFEFLPEGDSPPWASRTSSSEVVAGFFSAIRIRAIFVAGDNNQVEKADFPSIVLICGIKKKSILGEVFCVLPRFRAMRRHHKNTRCRYCCR